MGQIIAKIAEKAPSPLLDGRPARCWRRSERRRYAQHPQAHAELVVLHALSGQMRYLIDGKIVTLRAGSLLWAFAGQAHVLLSETPEFEMWVFLVSERLLPAGHASHDLPPLRIDAMAGEAGARIIGARQSAELEAIAAGLAAAPDSDTVGDGFRWWLTRAWRHWQDAPAMQTRPVHPAVNRAAAALQADPTRSVKALAGKTGLSAGRLGRLFREQTGKSIVRYRDEQKLDRVDRALQDRPMANLLTVALDAGFAGYPQFYRAFRKRRGVAPFDYYRRRDAA